MAFIGFVVVVISGVALILIALGIIVGCSVFGGKVEWFPVAVFGGSGAFALYFAVTHAPFAISLVG